MDLDRGALAKIDRKVLSGLGHDENYQMARLPLSEALWSTWRRYCDGLGISMGRAMVVLIENELRSVIDDIDGDLVLLARLESRFADRRASLDERERRLDAQEEELQANEHWIRARYEPARLPAGIAKVGRNDPCPCGSGTKYKRCHDPQSP